MTNPAMTNVVPLRLRALPDHAALAREADAAAAELMALVDELRAISGRVAALRQPGLPVERTVQHLLDAVTAVERAAEAVGHGAEAS